MVECSLIDLGPIDQEKRKLILDYLVNNKGIKPKDLGITSRYLSMLRSGQKPITDNVLCELLKHLAPEELSQLLKGFVPERRATMDELLRVIMTAKVDPAFRDAFISLTSRYLGDCISSVGKTWHATPEDVEAFEKALKLAGRTEKTVRDEIRYVMRALSELNWSLDPEGLREYLAGLAEDEPYVLKHTTYSLKSFLKKVLKPRDPGLFMQLYSAFTVFKPKNHNKRRLPTLEELRAIFNAIESIETKAYFIILAETGLRPGEPFLVTMDDVDLEHGMLRIGKITETKRSFIAFLRPETLDWVKKYYMPRREEFLRAMEPAWRASQWMNDEYIARAKSKFLPFDQGRLRREIKEASVKAIGREIELYDLRKFFASWMVAKGVPESIVNTLQGRAPPSEYRVLIEHYWSPRHEELRQWYLKHAPCILCSL